MTLARRLLHCQGCGGIVRTYPKHKRKCGCKPCKEWHRITE